MASRAALPQAGRSAVAVLLATGLVGGLGVLAAASPAAAAPPLQAGTTVPSTGTGKADPGDKLGARDQELLSQARTAGAKQVTLLLATTKGADGTSAAVSAVRSVGGWVGYRNDRLGYVRATVATAQVEGLVANRSVTAVDLKDTIQVEDPRPDGLAATEDPAPATEPVLTRQPTANPYMPIDETGAAAFRTASPTDDGRGITIGILDSGVDLDHPALQKTTTGERKIVDWVTATDPLEDASWRPMLTAVTGPSFTAADRTWTAPAGTFFFNRFSEAITTASEPAGDINRDGDTTDTFGVLYRASDHAIWVDQDQDGDFTDGPQLAPYRDGFQVQHFGTDDPATPIAETTPFVVDFRTGVDLTPAGLAGQRADFVSIGVVEDAHGSHVAGITAANGAAIADGAAPGAKLVSSRACTWGGGCTNVALTEGMIDLVANRKVDVVNMSIGGLPALNDGANARSALYTRLIEEYGVQMFISAGNSGPALNTTGDPGLSDGVISVGSSISKQTWKANYGSDVSAAQNLHNFSSRGPREDGGLAPQVVAPGSAISTVPLWLKQPDVAETDYALPIGYAQFNGTSMASPQAAGAAAVLLSASKARGIPVTPAQLRKALFSTATSLPGVSAAAQGMGLIDITKAYPMAIRRPATLSYTISAPVCAPLGEFLATPDKGTGVYNRCAADDGGQAVGSTKAYVVTVTRTTGPKGVRRHQLTLRGNDGTFAAGPVLPLALGKPTSFTLRATPKAEGEHSAVLLLDDTSSPGVESLSLHTVVAARTLPTDTFRSGLASTVERNRFTSYFVSVPEGTQALQVNLSGIATGSQTRFIATDPYGVPQDSTSSLDCYTNFSAPASTPCAPTSRSYLEPIPGVWELTVESRRTSPFLANPFTLTAAAQGVTVEPAVVTLPSATVGTPAEVSWKVTNDFGPTAITAEGGPLGSARTERPTIATGATQTYEVEVPEGTTRFDASIGNTADRGADLDLSVYLDDELVAQSADGDSEEAVSIPAPEAGTYTVEIAGFDVPAGTTAYDYRDVIVSPAYGTLTVPAFATTLAKGASATVTGVLEAARGAGEGRQLFGQLEVLSDRDALLGTGSVLVTQVVPAGAGTPVPTGSAAPTAGPTASPTVAPTASPTVAPSVSPSAGTTPSVTPSSSTAPPAVVG